MSPQIPNPVIHSRRPGGADQPRPSAAAAQPGEISAIAARHGSDPQAILEVLSDWQEQHGSLTPQVISQIARTLNMPAEKAYGVATFYSMLQVDDQVTQLNTIRVCDGPVCWLCGAAEDGSGAAETRHALEASISPESGWKVERSSCLGLCDRAPAALVGTEQAGPVPAGQAAELVKGYRGQPTDYSQPRLGELRVMMANAGQIDPDNLDSALAYGAYRGLQAALAQASSAVIDTVEASGLTGRGGAGFPVGRKWRFVFQAASSPTRSKYIICNADESEPLIFKDRVLIDTNPHQLLEGMAIAGYACGAQEAFIYIRGEYVSQAERLERAVQQAETAGWLGENIRNSGFSFHVHVHRGAGAYICGEETALIESLEGKRGEPRNRPPYPPSAGYLGMPTLVNNVESYCAVPHILFHGADWYRQLSSYPTPGTKMYMVLGHVNKPGLFEAPFGLTLRQVIEEFGGGMRPGSDFHFALTGGAAGTLVDASLLDTPIDYASAAKGISLGAGSFLICDQRVSPVAFLRELLHFFTVESCGKCTPCRNGTHRSLEILDRLKAGQGAPGDVQELLTLAEVMQVASFCGLGQSVAIPVKSALSHFAAAFESRVD